MSDLEKLCSVLSSCMESKACLDTKHLSGQKSDCRTRGLIPCSFYCWISVFRLSTCWWNLTTRKKRSGSPWTLDIFWKPSKTKGKGSTPSKPAVQISIQLIPASFLFFEKLYPITQFEKITFVPLNMKYRNLVPSDFAGGAEHIFGKYLIEFYFCIFQISSKRTPDINSSFIISYCLLGSETSLRSARVLSLNIESFVASSTRVLEYVFFIP